MTATTATAFTPAPISLPAIDAHGSAASRNPAFYAVEPTAEMHEAVDTYLASKSAQERAELDALIGAAPETQRMRRA